MIKNSLIALFATSSVVFMLLWHASEIKYKDAESIGANLANDLRELKMDHTKQVAMFKALERELRLHMALMSHDDYEKWMKSSREPGKFKLVEILLFSRRTIF